MKFIDCIEIVGNRPISFEGEKRYISTGAIDINHIDEDAVEIITYDERPSRADLSVCSGDVIFAKMAGTKKNMVIDETTEENIYSTGFFAVRGKEKVITARCLYYLVGSELFLKQKDKHSSGATQRAITNKGLENINISIPKLSEQGRIVSQLDSVASIIEKRKKELELLDDLIKARFVEMFGDLKSNNRGWRIVGFKECADIDTNMIHDFEGYEDYPHIGIDSIEKETGRLVGYRTIAEDGVISGKYLFSPAHIIYSKIRPNLNKVAMPDFEGLCSADAYPILVKEGICNREYFGYTLRSKYFLDYILAFSNRTNLPKVNKNQVEGFTLPLPPIDIQEQFSDFVHQVNKSKFDEVRK